MQMPPILQGESLTRLLQGAAVGCALTLIVGFGSGVVVLKTKAQKMANEASEKALVTMTTPICAASFAALATPADWDAFKNNQFYARSEGVKNVVKVAGLPPLDYGQLSACSDAIEMQGKKTAASK